MPLLSGLGAYAASRGEHWDGVLGLSDAFFACRENTVSQKFERRLAAIDFKVRRQELHRDDIKNLVELTTARMEMYHLVGALLLTAAVAWLADSHFTESYLPSETEWFINLLFISNISAIGYLIMCVWFAMYASIAAKSLGTRLLVSYARLSLPTADELKSIKNPIFFNPGDSLRSTFRRCCSEPDLHAGGEERAPSEDYQQHLRRFLEELPRWLVYDTWSRVCLSFGLLMMLQSMSYYTLGIFWPSPDQPDDRWFLAVFAFCATRMLCALMLWVDFSDLQPTNLDCLFALLMEALGPVLCVEILSEAPSSRQAAQSVGKTYWIIWSGSVFVVFAAHAAWVAFVAFRFDLAPMPGKAKGPHKFQPVNFANVLEWVKEKPNLPPPTCAQSACGEVRQGVRSTLKEVRPKFLRQGTDRILQEINAEDRSRNNDYKGIVNGARDPGTWMSYTQAESNFWHDDLDICKVTDWLPVRATRMFSLTMVAWWLVAGAVHTAFAEFESFSYFKKNTTDLQALNTSLFETEQLSLLVNLGHSGAEHIAVVQWPEPFFKVSSLYCSDSRIWVSNGFSVFAVVQNASEFSTSRNAHTSSVLKLAVVRDGHVGAILCHGQERNCQSLRKNTSNKQGESPWLLDTLAQPNGFMHPVPPSFWARRLHRAAVGISIPPSWRLLSAAWSSCAGVDCSSASMAGWDGEAIFIAVLWKEDSGDLPWAVRTRYELELERAVCADGFTGCHALGAPKYEDVKALQLSASGDMLTVLRSGGLVDEWNLQRRMLKRWRLDENYTAMCRGGDRIFLSRHDDTGPVLAIAKVPRTLNESKRSIVVNASGTNANLEGQKWKNKNSRHSFLQAGAGLVSF